MMATMRAFILAFCLATPAVADCSRQFLENATSSYIAAQAAGQPSLPLLSDTSAYLENNKSVDIKTGVLTTPLKLDSTRSVHDTVQCATFTEIIAASNPHPYVIGTRMSFENSKIKLIDSIVTDQDDWAFNATGYAYWNSIETSWDPIPEAKRDSRAVIQAAGDAYFDRWNNVSVVIPMSTPCARLEGGGEDYLPFLFINNPMHCARFRLLWRMLTFNLASIHRQGKPHGKYL